MELNKIHCGDCLELMKDLPDNSVDLVLTDPPYGINADKMQMGSGLHQWNKSLVWDTQIPSKDYFDEIQRISINQIIWGGNYFTNYLKASVNWIIWDKLNPNLSFSEAELAWVKTGKRIRIYKHYSANEEKQHPTQKPLKLFTNILIDYSQPNDLILDPFIGSGTTAVAAMRTGRNLIGMEISPEYCKIAEKRIWYERQQLKLAI